MRKIENFDSVSAAGSFDRPSAGGYVCIIKKVEDVPSKEYLHLEFDIAEGKYKNYAADTAERAGFWPLRCNRFYSAKSLGFFKAFIEAVQNTNKNFVWKWDESALVGKGVGIVFREEEYMKRDGTIGRSINPFEFKTAAQIRNGEFTVPEPKLLDQRQDDTPANSSVEDPDDLPF